jgi:hypothetical protein
MLAIAGQVITRHLEATIQRHENTAPLKDYCRNRFHWCTKTLSSIDWEFFSIMYTKISAHTWTFFQKFGWKQLATGAQLHRWTPSNKHQCPLCAQDTKTHNHFFQCQHLLRKQWRKYLLNSQHPVISLILTHSPLSKLGSWHTFRTVCHYSKKDFPQQLIQNYEISPTNKLQLDCTMPLVRPCNVK